MPEETTVTVGDTDVEIRETEGGFEATEVEEEPESETGLWLHAESRDGYGCEIPLSADFDVADAVTSDLYEIAWNEDDDRSDLKDDGIAHNVDEAAYDFSTRVRKSETEIVED